MGTTRTWSRRSCSGPVSVRDDPMRVKEKVRLIEVLIPTMQARVRKHQVRFLDPRNEKLDDLEESGFWTSRVLILHQPLRIH